MNNNSSSKEINKSLANKPVLSREVLSNFFTLSNFKEFFSEFQVIFYWLALFWASNLASDKINSVFEEVKYSVWEKLNQNLGTNFDISKQVQAQKIFQKVKNELWHDNVESPDFQKKLYTEIKKYEDMNWTKLIQSLILWFLYWFAYLKTIWRIKNEHMKIDIKSFSTFSLTSWWMVFVNWFIPWSLVYLESFLLAWYAVYLHLKNTVNDKHNISDYLNDALNLNPIPTSRYDEKWKPIVWNHALEKETWYTHKEVVEYFEKHGEIITLLYRWENLKEVKQYLHLLQENWERYEDVAFTMTTKHWEEKTFLWTTQVDPIIKWWNICFAKHLTDIEEVKKRLEETEHLLRIDKKTWAFNEDALISDFTSKIKDKRRKTSFIMWMFDIDNFKAINDKLWHEVWDMVLIELVNFLKWHLRDTDILYRLHWDEFSILFDSDNLEELAKKINKIRLEFYNHIKEKLWLEKWIWTSWWLTKIPPFSNSKTEISYLTESKKVDRYMYTVKYFRLIFDELVTEWVIDKNFEEKNWVSFPIFDENWDVIWVKVMNNFSNEWFILSLKHLDLIEKRKKELDDKKMRV